jgi:sugar phosphate isomerase/epimerase
MHVASPGRPHLSYCTNIHPGESLGDVRAILVDHATRVRALAGVKGAFGVGLRLSGRAARELAAPGELPRFRALLDELGLYVFTINGFPFGAFHGTRVKEAVYRPDWLERERVLYSDELAWILAALLPEGASGSVSTVPGAFRPRAAAPEDAARIAARIVEHAATLFRVREGTGQLVELALEPEPSCLLETSDDCVRFFEEHLFRRSAILALSGLTGLSAPEAEAFLRRHVGVCLDACHLAVEFEDARAAVRRFGAAGIRVGKVQVTAALRVELSGARADDERTLRALERFDDGVYLHQVVERRADGIVRHLDLPDAVAIRRAASESPPSEWRVHFHVPVFAERIEPFGSTQPFVTDLLGLARGEAVSDHFEVETYTWDVLPPEHRTSGVDEAIARELSWTIERLGGEAP